MIVGKEVLLSDQDQKYQERLDYEDELMMIESTLEAYPLEGRQVVVFERSSKGKGRRRRDPVEVALVKVGQIRQIGRKVPIGKYVTHKDGDDRIDAYVRESLGEMVEDFSEADSLELVRKIEAMRLRVRILRRILSEPIEW